MLQSPARFRVLCCGRRWRKSSTALIALVRAAEAQAGGLYFWVWPSYPQGQTGWDMLISICAGKWETWESRRRVRAPNGSEIWIKSADHPDSLRGFGLDGAVLDECRFISARTWPEIIRPALSDKLGWAIFNSTPLGYNWFYALHNFARDNGPEWAAWTFTTHDNPAIDRAELAQIEMTTPTLVWRQEYLADFSAGAELGVFRNVRTLATLSPAVPEQHTEHYLVAGVDFAQTIDFTAICVLCLTCHEQVFLDRFNRCSWEITRARIKQAITTYSIGQVLAEQNSIGGPNIEALQNEGLPVIPFVTTPLSKEPLIRSLQLAVERSEIKLLDDEIQTAELEAYQSTPSRITGRPTFSAPEGQHDDTVMALALANSLLTAGGLEIL